MGYTKTAWVNSPATSSPVNATNLNKIETGIYDVYRGLGVVPDATGVASTDNANVQFAISAISAANAGELVFGTGLYNLTSAMTGIITGGSFASTSPGGVRGLTIRGMGRGVTFLRFTPAAATSLFTVGDGAAASGFVTFQDMTIHLANNTAVAAIRLLDPCSYCVIQRVQFIGNNVLLGTGVQIDGQVTANTDHEIRDCTFRSLGSGIRTSGNANSLFVDNCNFAEVNYGIRAEALAPDTLGGNNGTVNSCDFTNSGGGTLGVALRSGASKWTFEGINVISSTTSLDMTTGADHNTFVGCNFATAMSLAGTSATTSTFVACRRTANVPEIHLGDVRIWRSAVNTVSVRAALNLADATDTDRWTFGLSQLSANSFGIGRTGATNVLNITTADEMYLANALTKLRFYNNAGAVLRQTVAGSRAGNAALASLLTALGGAGVNLINDTTTV